MAKTTDAHDLGKVSNDDVVLRLVDGREWRVAWCTPLAGGESIQTALLPRMPISLVEQEWVWRTLTKFLAPGGSIRFVGPSLHA